MNYSLQVPHHVNAFCIRKGQTPMRVSRSRLTKRAAGRCGVSQRLAAIIVDSFLEEWKDALTQGDVIEITHFLSMRLVTRSRRPGGSLNNTAYLDSVRTINYEVLMVNTSRAFRAQIKKTRGRFRRGIESTQG